MPEHIQPPFRRVLQPIRAFLRTQATSGVVLLLSAIAAVAWANVDPGSYEAFWNTPVQLAAGAGAVAFTLEDVISEGLMTVFFFVVGLEIKRELVSGELRTPSRALLPGVAAFGGMLVPAAVYLLFTQGTAASRGWAVPMATDIAFCVGCLALLGGRVPHGLRVFLTALAIFDDIGGILVIALFYGSGIHVWGVVQCLGVAAVLAVMNRRDVQSPLAYLAAGSALWVAFHHAGLHATLAGVALGLAVPARPKRPVGEVLGALHQFTADCMRAEGGDVAPDDIGEISDALAGLQSPLRRFEHALHPWVAYAIMPLFALANSGVHLGDVSLSDLTGPLFLGIALGLFLGKQLGVFAFTFAAVRAGLASRPSSARWGQIYGVAVVAGIGFTVALFIANLAFASNPHLLAEARLGILVGSLVSGVVGTALLLATSPAAPRPA